MYCSQDSSQSDLQYGRVLFSQKKEALEEAFEYARSIKERFVRQPEIEDFYEEFPFFVNGQDFGQYPMLPIKRQLGEGFEDWKKHHKSVFENFDAFLTAALNESK